MSLYAPARAVMVIQDNGEDVMVELPEIQELLDQINGLHLSNRLTERCLQACESALQWRENHERQQVRRLIICAAAGWILAAAGWILVLVR